MVDLSRVTWRKSSYSNGTGGDCCEVAPLPDGGRALRDSKNPDGPLLLLSKQAWRGLVQGIKAGQFS